MDVTEVRAAMSDLNKVSEKILDSLSDDFDLMKKNNDKKINEIMLMKNEEIEAVKKEKNNELRNLRNAVLSAIKE